MFTLDHFKLKNKNLVLQINFILLLYRTELADRMALCIIVCISYMYHMFKI